MRNILFAADFPMEKSGIISTASSILAEEAFGPTKLYSDQDMLINGIKTRPTRQLGNASVDLIFSHTEYLGLPKLLRRYPTALVHVGDWPLMYWRSLAKNKPVKGRLAEVRCHIRLSRIPRSARLCFVTEEDCDSAVDYGFFRASYLPIGIKSATVPLAPKVDSQTLCFSGNFRYEPNRDAALKLLDLVRSNCPGFTVLLVGFHADDFASYRAPNVEIHSDVPSIVDFLAARRPIYISMIETGAGAKNKILEAIVAGCPIFCTPQSLDASIPAAPSINVVTSDEEAISKLRKVNFANVNEMLNNEATILAEFIQDTRSWRHVAEEIGEMFEIGV